MVEWLLRDYNVFLRNYAGTNKNIILLNDKEGAENNLDRGPSVRKKIRLLSSK